MLSAQQLNNLIQKNSQSESIGATVQHDLEKKMLSVLNEPGVTSYEKAKRYNILLQKLLTLVRRGEQEGREIVLKLPTTTTSESDINENIDAEGEKNENINEILQQLPPRSKKNAGYILQKLQDSDGVLKWNPSGEIIIRGNPIKGSHILDLMKTLAQQQRTRDGNFPIGWEPFINIIDEVNIPLTSISNVSVRKQLQNLKESSGFFHPSTPYTERQRRRKKKASRKSTPDTSSPQAMEKINSVFETPTEDSVSGYQLWASSPLSPRPDQWLHYNK